MNIFLGSMKHCVKGRKEMENTSRSHLTFSLSLTGPAMRQQLSFGHFFSGSLRGKLEKGPKESFWRLLRFIMEWPGAKIEILVGLELRGVFLKICCGNWVTSG